VSETFQPTWLRVALLIAVIVGIATAAWLFWSLAGTG
jgi:hypothetical protein